jgi:hypothetical protein
MKERSIRMSKWIDAKKQPPADDGRYLCYWNSIFIARYIKSVDKWEREDVNTGLNQMVSHWMLFPEPPV